MRPSCTAVSLHLYSPVRTEHAERYRAVQILKTKDVRLWPAGFCSFLYFLDTGLLCHTFLVSRLQQLYTVQLWNSTHPLFPKKTSAEQHAVPIMPVPRCNRAGRTLYKLLLSLHREVMPQPQPQPQPHLHGDRHGEAADWELALRRRQRGKSSLSGYK